MFMLLAFLLAVGIALPLAVTVYAYGDSYRQCSNGTTNPLSCDWINGNINGNNSHYAEGMGVSQRPIWITLNTLGSQVYTFTWQVSWTDASTHGYDFLMSWAQAQATALVYAGVPLNLNVCQGETGAYATACTNLQASGFFADVVVPDDSFVSGSFVVNGSTQSRINAFESIYGNRTVRLRTDGAIIGTPTLTLRHVDPNNASITIADGGDLGATTDIQYTLVFTSATATQAMLEYAAHLAISGNPYIEPMAWGQSLGAGSTGGSNWHVKDPKFNGGGGSQDNQIQLRAGTPAMASQQSSSGVNLGATDAVTLTASGFGNDITGNVKFYVCRDNTAPWSPASSSAIPNGCLTTTAGTGYTVDYVGAVSLTVNNSSQTNRRSVSTSLVYTPTQLGFYCFMTVYEPDTLPFLYTPTRDTNNSTECFTLGSPTAITLSAMNATPGDDPMTLWGVPLAGLALGILGIGASFTLWKFGSRRF
ncbi:MAG: hypothetical protein HZC40_20540 [Chloroflexi bacterium]|nr:hypothetical protein [Chloroflexota bacterium]